jgi:DNA-binding response OmpR family regulator
MKVLIIDDDADDRELFCEAMLQVAKDVQCLPFTGGQEGIDYLRSAENLPDFVFLDIQMHQMDGKECLLRIKRIKSMERVSIVIYSSSIESEREMAIYKKLGANYVMEKPPSFDALCQNLDALFTKSRANKSGQS